MPAFQQVFQVVIVLPLLCVAVNRPASALDQNQTTSDEFREPKIDQIHMLVAAVIRLQQRE